MTTHAVTLDDEVIRLVEAAAQAERKTVVLWMAEHIRRDAEEVLARAERADTARRQGHSEEWISQFILRPASALDDDPSFAAPPRGFPRAIPSLDAF